MPLQFPHRITEQQVGHAIELHDTHQKSPSKLMPRDAHDVLHAVGSSFVAGDIVPETIGQLLLLTEVAEKANSLVTNK